MASNCTIFPFIILYVFCLNCFGKDVFNITRSTSIEYDLFQLPSCSQSCSNFIDGSDYHGSRACTCACKQKSSTFGSANNVWQCQENDKLRIEAGCNFYFDGETSIDHIMILSERPQTYHIILPGLFCTIQYTNSRYRECDGKWIALSNLVKSPGPFSLVPFPDVVPGSVPRRYRFTLKVRSKKRILGGKLIQLRLKCEQKKSCVLLKIEGSLHCPANATTSSSSTQNPATPITTDPTTDLSTSSNKLPVTYLTTKPSLKTTRIAPATITIATTKSVGKVDRNPHSSNTESSYGLVAAIISVLVIFAFLIAVLFGYVFWKRKRGESVWLFNRFTERHPRTSPPKAYQTSETGETIYSEIPENRVNGCRLSPQSSAYNQELYSFAFENPDAVINERVSTEDHSLYEEARAHVNNSRRSVLDEEGYIMPKEARGYNSAKSWRETKDNGVQNNRNVTPLNRDCNTIEDLKEREYYVLERPLEQEYSTLEGPNEQVYNVLEDPNEHKHCDASPPLKATRSKQVPPLVNPISRKRQPTPPRVENRVPMRPKKGRENTNGQDTSSVYESLRDSDRPSSIYESLNLNTLSRK